MKKQNKIVGMKIEKLKGAMNTYYKCPNCKKFINKDDYCSKCGTKLN